MKKFTKFILVSAAIALAAGIVLGGIGFAADGVHNINIIWNKGFKVSEDEKAETMEKTSFDSFSNIDLDISAAKISFKKNDSDEYAVEYKLMSTGVKCEVKNDTLVVDQTPESISFNFLNFSGLEDCYITIYYPEGSEFDSIKVNTSAGSINAVEGLKCNVFDLNSSAGGIKIDGFTGAIIVDSSAGGFEAKNSDFTKVTMEMSAGGIIFNNCTIGGGKIDASAGSLEAKGITLNGSLDCDLSAGGFDLSLQNGDDVGFDLDVSAGSVTIDGSKVVSNDSYKLDITKDVVLTVDCSAGSIKITR